MSRGACWSYVQARLSARHGDRLDSVGWRMLDAARSPERFLEQARATSLRRFTDRLDAGMSSHAIERILRAEWRDYVAEVAAWVPTPWQPAVRWVAFLSDLPVLDGIVRGETPDWLREEPLFTPLAEAGRDKLAALFAESRFAPLAPPGEQTLAQQWLAQWRAMWPKGRDREGIETLIAAVAHHGQRPTHAGSGDASSHHRGDLAPLVERLFRRHNGTPVAMFAHLTLIALDLERLRGGLVRRRLFNAEPPKRAA